MCGVGAGGIPLVPTAYSLLRRSLRLIRVIDPGETLEAAEAQDGLEVLNDMLDSWRLEGLMAYDIERVVFSMTAGTQSYTLGPGGTWSTTALFGAGTTRPVKIHHLGLIDTSSDPDLETPIDPMSNTAYQDLRLKATTSAWPTRYQYSPGVPLGTVFLWPSPTVNRSVAAYLWRSLTQWTTAQTNLTLPEGYAEAIVYNLCPRLAPEYGASTPMEVLALARDTKAVVMQHNAEPVVLMPDPLCPGQRMGGGWNYITDEPA